MYRAAPLVAAVSCAVLTAAVAIPRAVQYAFWQDEVGAARVITRAGPIEMLRNVAGTELHPPGFYALGWVLSRLGAPAVWGRGISVAAAIALTIVVVLYAARLMPVYGAALAGLATALGWQFVDHSWELRPYSLFALVCVLFALALERAAERPSLGRLALLAFATAAGLMTHYFFAFTLVAGAIWLVGIRPARTVLLALGAGLVPLLMWAPAAYQQYHDGGYKWIGAFQLRAAVGVYAASLYRAPPGYVLGFIVLALVLAGALRLWRLSDRGRLCALCAIVPVLVSAIVWLTGHEIFLARNLIGAAPFAVIAAASALSGGLPRPVAVPATVLAGAVLVAAHLHTRGPIVPEYDRVAEALVKSGWQEEDPILLFGPRYAYLHPLDWYLPGQRLEVAGLKGTACRRVFVVGVGGHGRALIGQRPSLRVERVVIARIPYRRGLQRDVQTRGGTVFATRTAGCARVA